MRLTREEMNTLIQAQAILNKVYEYNQKECEYDDDALIEALDGMDDFLGNSVTEDGVYVRN